MIKDNLSMYAICIYAVKKKKKSFESLHLPVMTQSRALLLLLLHTITTLVCETKDMVD